MLIFVSSGIQSCLLFNYSVILLFNRTPPVDQLFYPLILFTGTTLTQTNDLDSHHISSPFSLSVQVEYFQIPDELYVVTLQSHLLFSFFDRHFQCILRPFVLVNSHDPTFVTSIRQCTIIQIFSLIFSSLAQKY